MSPEKSPFDENPPDGAKKAIKKHVSIVFVLAKNSVDWYLEYVPALWWIKF
jgi:hypothetical protein